MASPLTANFCQLVYNNDQVAENIQPVLQVLSVKRINTTAGTAGANDRYRVILSDGNHFIQSMLATQMNHFVDEKLLEKNVVIKLLGFVTNAVQGRKLIIILSLEIVPWNGEKIGNPINLESAPAAGTSALAPVNDKIAAAASAVPSNAGSRSGFGGAKGVAPSRTGKSAGGKSDMGPIFPIEGLSPYQNKWTIKARVTAKSEIKHWSNQRGEGKLFNVTLMDETGEIRATGFNEAVDNFYNLLEEGKVFFISRARINIAKKQFNNVNNEYEIAFENHTEIEPCDDDSVPQVKYNFKRINELADLEKDSLTDVIGVVKEVGELGSVTSKATQKPFAKRDIQLVDQSGQSVRLTLWGKQAESFSGDDEPVIAFKGVKVGDFGGRSLSMFSSATMSVNPDIPEAHSLRGWYDAEGRHTSFTAYTNASIGNTTRSEAGAPRPNEVKTIGQVKDEGLGMNEKTDFFSTNGTIMFIKHETFSYPACANPDGCNKKVIEDGQGWLCEKCNQHYPAPIHRYILQINIMDHAGHIWITAFNEVAEQIMGISANDLMALRDSGDEASFQRQFNQAIGQTLTFQMMAKQDSFNDQLRVRYQCRKASKIDYAADSSHLISQINLMSV